jgi:hypothetical protein
MCEAGFRITASPLLALSRVNGARLEPKSDASTSPMAFLSVFSEIPQI